MKNKKKRILLTLGLIVSLTALLFSSFALALTEIDPASRGSITVEIKQPGSGQLYKESAIVSIYHAANLILENNGVQYAATEEFKDSDIDFASLTANAEKESAAISNALLAYAKRNVILPLEAQSGSSGSFTFKDLDLGLYLVSYTSLNGQLTVNPFLVFIPSHDAQGNGWYYDLTVYPKYSAIIPSYPPYIPPESPPPTDIEETGAPKDPGEPGEPDKSPGPDDHTQIPDPDNPGNPGTPGGDPGKLPQTGMLRWPILLLGITGVGSFSAGWVKLFVKKGERDE